MRSADSVRLGSQEPRSLWRPDGTDPAAADESVVLAEFGGLQLDPWQQNVLHAGLGRADGRWAVSEVGCWVPRQNGKGSIIEALVLGAVFQSAGPTQIIWSAHEYKTASQGFRRFKTLVYGQPYFAAQVTRKSEQAGEQSIEFAGGRLVQWNTRSRTALRGFSADLIVLDEAQELTSEQIDAVMPVISARPDAQLWYFGTPPSSPAAWCYTLKRAGEDRQPDLAWLDWGLDLVPDGNGEYSDRDLADEDNWYRANPALGGRIRHEAVVREHNRLGQGFARERLGVWLPAASDQGRALSAAEWAAARRPAPLPPGKPLALAFDAWGNRWAIARAWLLPDGVTAVEIAEEGPDARVGAQRLLDMRERHRDAVVVHVDSYGPSASVIPELAQWRKVKPLRSGDLLDAWARFVGDVAAGRVIHPGDPLLDAAVAGAAVRKVGDRVALDRSRSSPAVPALMAAIEAVWGVAKHRPTRPSFAQT